MSTLLNQGDYKVLPYVTDQTMYMPLLEIRALTNVLPQALSDQPHQAMLRNPNAQFQQYWGRVLQMWTVVLGQTGVLAFRRSWDVRTGRIQTHQHQALLQQHGPGTTVQPSNAWPWPILSMTPPDRLRASLIIARWEQIPTPSVDKSSLQQITKLTQEVKDCLVDIKALHHVHHGVIVQIPGEGCSAQNTTV